MRDPRSRKASDTSLNAAFVEPTDLDAAFCLLSWSPDADFSSTGLTGEAPPDKDPLLNTLRIPFGLSSAVVVGEAVKFDENDEPLAISASSLPSGFCSSTGWLSIIFCAFATASILASACADRRLKQPSQTLSAPPFGAGYRNDSRLLEQSSQHRIPHARQWCRPK